MILLDLCYRFYFVEYIIQINPDLKLLGAITEDRMVDTVIREEEWDIEVKIHLLEMLELEW